MKRRILSIVIAAIACIAASAQGTCVINGNIADSQLADGKKVKKVYLTRTDEFGKATTVATAKVKKGSYTFKYELAQDDPVMQYTVTGFGEGEDKGITLFVEPGEVVVNTASATQPEQSTTTGTPTNDAYTQYKAILSGGQAKVAEEIAALEQQHGKQWLETAEGQRAVRRIKAKEAINTESQALRFLIEHNASPMMPLEVVRILMPKLSEAYAEQVTNAVSATLHNHPYYHALRNQLLANTLKVGNEVPDITLPMLTGETAHLADYRGKYIILNFWTPGCEKSAEMLAELKNVYELVKDQKDYLILSFALDSDAAAWKEAITAQGIDLQGWLHACDGMGIESPAAKRFKVEKAPKIVLIEPEGHAVSLDMDIDEVAIRIEQILSGDLYYFDQEK